MCTATLPSCWAADVVVRLLDECVALARSLLKAGALEDFDTAARATNQAGSLELERRLGHALPAHTEHVSDQFLRHHQI